MTLTFADKKLEKMAADYDLCCRKMGSIRAAIYHTRLGVFLDVKTLEEVRSLPGRFHTLYGNRRGQWACDLDHPYRLIFRPDVHPVPVNEHGQFIWSAITSVEILEITDYH